MKLSPLFFAFILLGISSFYSCTDDMPAPMDPELRKGCYCPMVYDPVTCNGVTYSNGCFASCAGATDCVSGNTW